MPEMKHIHRRTGMNNQGTDANTSSLFYIIIFLIALCCLCQSIYMIIYRLR